MTYPLTPRSHKATSHCPGRILNVPLVEQDWQAAHQVMSLASYSVLHKVCDSRDLRYGGSPDAMYQNSSSAIMGGIDLFLTAFHCLSVE